MLAYIVVQYLFTGISMTVSPLQTIRATIFFILLLAICGVVIYRILKDHAKAGLVLWLIAELFMFSQAFFIVSMIISVVTLVCWVGIAYLRKKKILLNHITFLLSVLGFALITMALALRQIPLRLYLTEPPQIVEQQKPILMTSAPPPIFTTLSLMPMPGQTY